MLFVEEPLLSVGIVTGKIITFELHGDFSVLGFKDNFSGVYTAEIKNNEINLVLKYIYKFFTFILDKLFLYLLLFILLNLTNY